MNESAFFGLDMNSILGLIIAVSLVILGGYCVYTAIRLQRTYELVPNKVLYPANTKPEDCKDDVGFIRFMVPRVGIFGALCVLLGVLRALLTLTDLGQRLPSWIGSLGMVLLFLPLMVWYVILINRAYRRFF